jgi:glyoxylase-like metal-dependent hydrolase (beta-lactamase superfamily II)
LIVPLSPFFTPILLEAGNPSPMTGRGNNTYLIVGTSGASALIDAGVGNSQHLAEIDRTLAAMHARLSDVLVTHGHADHASGAPALAAAHPEARFAKHPWPEEDRHYGVTWHPLFEGDAVAIGDERLQVIFAPGHSPDHLVFWHEPSRTVFTGDLVTAGSSVMIHWSRGGNLIDYLASLRRLLALRPQRLLPAHGAEPDDPEALLSGYLEHRHMRERQVIAALAAERSTVQEIADSIYDGLDPALMAAARENVRAHLEKLKTEGRAVVEAERWRICGERD